MEFLRDSFRNAQRLFLQGRSLRREGNYQIPLVLRILCPGEIALCLQLLQKRAEGVGFQAQRLAEELLVDLLFLPENHHDDVLGIGQIQPVEKGLVFPGDQVGYGIQGKTQLIFQTQRGVSVIHGFHLRIYYIARDINCQ